MNLIKHLMLLSIFVVGPMANAMEGQSSNSGDPMATGINQLAFDLYQEIAKTKTDLTFSPLSISTALGMTYAGAKKETETAMKQVLHYGDNTEAFHKAAGAFTDRLSKTDRSMSGTVMNISNMLWVQEGFKMEAAYMDLLGNSYAAMPMKANFKTEAQQATAAINAAVAKDTNGEIPQLLKNELKSDTRFVLTNAVYFNAKWKDEFVEALSHDADFTKKDGQTMNATYMSQSRRHRYGENDDMQYVLKPYKDGEFAALFVLPAEGKFDMVSDAMNEGMYNQMLSSMTNAKVNLMLPKFNVRTTPAVKEILAAKGLGVMFDKDHANLSGINGIVEGDDKLFISDVVHEAVVKMYEAGTTAAAATAVVGAVTTSIPMPEPSHNFIANRPFLFFIIHEPTNAIMFMGRIMEPSTL